MGTFFQLVLLIADDARRVPHEYVEIARTLGAKSRHVLRWIILPAMLPSMGDPGRRFPAARALEVENSEGFSICATTSWRSRGPRPGAPKT